MRIFLKLVGVVLVMLVVAAVFVYRAGVRYDREARAYVEQTVKEIAAEWEPVALFDHSSPEMLQAQDGQYMASMCRAYMTLYGGLIMYDPPTGRIGCSYKSGEGLLVSGRYLVTGDFTKGAATVKVIIVRRGGDWQLTYFGVEPGFNAQWREPETYQGI